MKATTFEQGKTYRYAGTERGTVDPLYDGLPHKCLTSRVEGYTVHAAFDCDLLPTLLNSYSREEILQFEEVEVQAEEGNRAFVPGGWIEVSADPHTFFGVDTVGLSFKVLGILMHNVGGNIEGALLKEIQEGRISIQELAALGAIGLGASMQELKR